MSKILPFYLLLFLNSSIGYCQTKSLFSYENDNLKSFGVLSGKDDPRTDEDYSFGLNSEVSNPVLAQTFYSKNIIEKLFLKQYTFSDTSNHLIYNKVGTIGLFCAGYTPKNIKAKTIQFNERPYFSILEANYSLSYLLIDKEQKRAPKIFTTTLGLGIIGTNASKFFQNLNHSLLNHNNTRTPWLPEGWPNQISNGGEPTVIIQNKLKYLLFSNSLDHFSTNQRTNFSDTTAKRFLEFTLAGQSSIGYITSLGGQAGARIGILGSRNWSSETDAMNLSNNAFENQKGRKSKRQFECYIQSQFTSNYEFYNASLSGQFRKTKYTIPSKDIIHLIYTFQNNINFNFPGKNKYILISYNFYTFRSPYLKNAIYANGTHEWGGVYISCVFNPF